MSYSTQGSSNRQEYDCCKYAQDLQQSVDPLSYQLYFGAQESCSKCIDKKAWFKQDGEIVDIESDLQNYIREQAKTKNYESKILPQTYSELLESAYEYYLTHFLD